MEMVGHAMNVSSRTLDGLPNRCPVCQHDIRISPSEPTGDAPCPHCGVLLWFVVDDDVTRFHRKGDAQVVVRLALTTGDTVRIYNGAFEGFEGIVRKMDPVTKVASIKVNILGREKVVDVPWFALMQD